MEGTYFSRLLLTVKSYGCSTLEIIRYHRIITREYRALAAE
jgi:hypothetical protein